MKHWNTRKTTIVILLVAIVGLIGWDVFVATNDVQGDTISEIMLSWATKVALLPLAMGTLMGHLFWPNKGGKYHIDVIVLVVILVGVRDVCAWVWNAPQDVLVQWVLHALWFPLIPLLAGIPLGHYAWPQTPDDATQRPDDPPTEG